MNSFSDPPLRVYIAGPLTNLDESARRECEQLRDLAKTVFRRCRDAHFELYDPGDHTPPESDHKPHEVYYTDYRRSMDADLIFFYRADIGSNGAGIEAQISADMTIPKLVAYKENSAVSKMLTGIFSPTLDQFSYVGNSEFEIQLEKRLPSIIAKLNDSVRLRNPIRDAVRKARLGREVFKQRIRRKIPLPDLANRTDIRKEWLAQLERNDDQAASLTIMQLKRLANVLSFTLAMADTGIPTFHFDESLPENAEESLGNLVDLVRSEDEWKECSKLFRLWDDNEARLLMGAKDRNPSRDLPEQRPVIDVDTWRKLYREMPLL